MLMWFSQEIVSMYFMLFVSNVTTYDVIDLIQETIVDNSQIEFVLV
jgi:hypothetical protein